MVQKLKVKGNDPSVFSGEVFRLPSCMEICEAGEFGLSSM